jgi:hypothetical protein
MGASKYDLPERVVLVERFLLGAGEDGWDCDMTVVRRRRPQLPVEDREGAEDVRGFLNATGREMKEHLEEVCDVE